MPVERSKAFVLPTISLRKKDFDSHTEDVFEAQLKELLNPVTMSKLVELVNCYC